MSSTKTHRTFFHAVVGRSTWLLSLGSQVKVQRDFFGLKGVCAVVQQIQVDVVISFRRRQLFFYMRSYHHLAPHSRSNSKRIWKTIHNKLPFFVIRKLDKRSAWPFYKNCSASRPHGHQNRGQFYEPLDLPSS